MGIHLRIAKLRCDSVFQLFRNEMLQPLRLFVNFIPAVIEYIVQETFQQSMMP